CSSDLTHTPVGLAVLTDERRDAADTGRLGLRPDLADPVEQLGRVGGGDGRRRIEAGALCGQRDLQVCRDVLALAEERFVEGMLELPQAALAPRPQARCER